MSNDSDMKTFLTFIIAFLALIVVAYAFDSVSLSVTGYGLETVKALESKSSELNKTPVKTPEKIAVKEETLPVLKKLENEIPESSIQMHGYIVEFNDEPVFVFAKNYLDKKKSGDFKELSENEKADVRQKAFDSKRKVNKDIDEVRKELKKPLMEPIAVFTSVFNGAALDISEEEALQLKKLGLIKNFYPNFLMKAELMDSVPLIGADLVWQTNQNNSSCSVDSPAPDFTPIKCASVFPDSDAVYESWDKKNSFEKDGLTVVKKNNELLVYSINEQCDRELVSSVQITPEQLSEPIVNSVGPNEQCYSYGDVDFDGGRVDLDDILCVIRGFHDIASCPSGDVFPCGGNGVIDLDDIQSVLSAFSGNQQSPYYCPAVCSTCGNGLIEAAEECEINTFSAETCSILGQEPGTLNCILPGEPQQCHFDYSFCNDECLTGNQTIIAIIDSGVNYTNPDLGGCFGPNCKVLGGFDFINNDSDPMDDMGHGTHVASIAAGNGVLKGVAPNAKIVAYKVLDSTGTGPVSGAISAIELSVDPNQDQDFSDHLDVINMSIGVDCIAYVGGYNELCGPNDAFSTAVDNASGFGVVVVVAAGNEGPNQNTLTSPGTARDAITVGASCKPNQVGVNGYCLDSLIAVFSSTGHTPVGIKPDVSAPGVGICASQHQDYHLEQQCIDDMHTVASGTSMAAPHVTGAAALLKQKNKLLSAKQIKDILKQTAANENLPMARQGYGVINVFSAAQLDTTNLGLLPLADLQTEGKAEHTTLSQVIGTSVNGSYSVYYTANHNEEADLSNWIEVCSGNQNITNGVLCEWNTSNLSDGIYLLRIETTNNNQRKSFDESIVELESAQIIYPKNVLGTEKEITPTWRNELTVIGTASGAGFSHYTLEFCSQSQNCFPVIIDDNTDNIFEGELGRMDISGLESGYYDLTLRVFAGSVLIASDFARVYVDDSLVENWPMKFDGYVKNSSPLVIANPTTADLDSDGENEIIYAYKEKISVFKQDGTQLAPWPIEINTSCVDGEAIMQAGPAIANLDKDLELEIVVGDSCGYVHVFDDDGAYLNSNWPKKFTNFLTGLELGNVGSITLSDINNDAQIDILFRTFGGQQNAVNLQGNALSGWPFNYIPFSSGYNSASVFDANNDGFKEIVMDSVEGSSRIYVFRHNGVVANGWPKIVGCNADKLVVDLENDGIKEIIVFSGTGQLHAYNFSGIEKPGWPKFFTGFNNCNFFTGLSAGDIDNDNSVDIVFTGGGMLGIVNNQGIMKAGFPITSSSLQSAIHGFPLIGQLDSDSQLEVTAPTFESSSSDALWNLYAFNHDGTFVDGFPKKLTEKMVSFGAPIVDVDGDGENEVVVGPVNSGDFFIWNTSGLSTQNNWSDFYFNEKHNSCLGC